MLRGCRGVNVRCGVFVNFSMWGVMMGKLSELIGCMPVIEVTEVMDGKTIPRKDGSGTRRIQWQEGFLLRIHRSGRLMPLPVRVEIRDGDAPRIPGMYVFDSMNFESNDFGEILLKKYDRIFTPIPPDVWAMIEQDQKRAAA
jgi:hypothetical protein